MKPTYTTEQLRRITDQYSVIGDLQETKLFKIGTDNSNYYLKTNEGEYALRIYDGMNLTEENILFEIEVMKRAHTAGVKSPHVIEADNDQTTVEFNEFYSIIMDFIPGENMKGKELSEKVVEQLGEEVGKMDSALSSFKDEKKTRQNYIFDLENFLTNEPNIKLLSSEYNQEIFTKIIQEYKEKKEKIHQLPRGIIHNDIVLHNLLVKDDELTGILDFSDIAFSPYIQNLAIAMAQTFFTYNWQPQHVSVFLASYRKYHALSNEELQYLYLLTRARYLTLVVEFNRWMAQLGGDNDILEFVTDSYNFLLKFEKLGEKEFNNLLGI